MSGPLANVEGDSTREANRHVREEGDEAQDICECGSGYRTWGYHACRNGLGNTNLCREAERVKGNNGPLIGAVSRSRSAHQGQSSGPNEVSEGAKPGAERLTALFVGTIHQAGAEMDLVGDMLSIIFGICLMVFHRSFGKRAMSEQNRFWKCSLGELTANGIAVSAFICGGVFAFLGVIGLSGRIHLW